MIERTISKRIRSLGKDFKVILATGARQVGKTTLLKCLMEEDREYITLDNSVDRELAKDDPEAFFYIHKVPCLIDEVQRAPELFLKIKEIVDSLESKNLIWITGSQKLRLMKNVSETLVGRVVEVDMFPLSQAEKQNDALRPSFYPSFNGNKDAPWSYEETIKNIILGGYPALQFVQPENIGDWFRSYINTYILGDINDGTEKINEIDFIRFLRIIAARTASELNYSSIAKESGLTIYKVTFLIALLESFGIIKIIPPYYGNTIKTLTKTARLHFIDTGLCCYLLGISTVEGFLSHRLKGAIFESYVVSELYKNAVNNGDNANFYFYREEAKKKKDENGNGAAEIDLIKEKAGRLYPIEIKLSATPDISMAKNFYRLDEKLWDMGTIVCLYNKKTLLRRNILIQPVSMI